MLEPRIELACLDVEQDVFKEDRMGKRGREGSSAEKIVTMLRAVEVDQGEGKPIKEAIVEHGVTEQTFYRWRRQYGTYAGRRRQAPQGPREGEPASQEARR